MQTYMCSGITAGGGRQSPQYIWTGGHYRECPPQYF